MKNSARFFLSSLIILLVSAFSLSASVKLPVLISDGMVLQRDQKIVIWGWASPGEKVKVKLYKESGAAITDKSGSWTVTLPPLKAGGPYKMEVSGNNTIVINDILIGDVWFCSGQSNMVINMERVREKYPDDIASANYPQIRNFFVPTASDARETHQDLPPGKWIAASPENVLGFGAATFFFARNIYKLYNVPIGIINSSVGGIPVEAWISEQGLKDFPVLEERIGRLRDTSYLNPAMRSARKRFESAQSEQEKIKLQDKGLNGPKTWYDPSYVPECWHKFWLPGYWEDQGIRDLDGIVWFRKEVNIPERMAGKPARLFLGRIVDADNVYINGVASGNTTYQYPPRRYNLPAGLLKAGKNTFVVRVSNNAGKGGFVPDKPYYLVAGGDTLDLRGDWIYKVGEAFRPSLPDFGAPLISMQNEPSGLYNTMVAPAINFRIKGFLWYQGETNTGRPAEYAQLLPALISDWRDKWKEGSLPFLYVQLPNFMEVQYLPSESQWAELRYSQLKTLSVPNTAMAVTIDAGEWNDIHPLGKKVVGERLALAARKLAYGDQNLVWSGPVFKSISKSEGKLMIEFDYTGGGLTVKGGGDLNYFAIAGADKKFVWAEASVNGNHVVVSNNEVPDPVYVRYAWADNPEGANLYNAEGLPASPFEASIAANK